MSQTPQAKTSPAATSEIQRDESRFRVLFENSPDAIFVEDLAGNVLDVNRSACELHGLPREQLVGKNAINDLIPPANRAAAAANLPKLARGEVSWIDSESIRADGLRVPVQIRVAPIDYDGQPALLFHVRDVTAQKKLEEQLRQSQKMEAIGQLAGGIAHDFNNILTVILGNASLLAMSDLDENSIESARQIKHASERAAGLTAQLLAFGRKQVFNPRPVDLNRIIGKMSDMIARLIGETIDLQLNFSGDPALVVADTSMMEQIILNLSVNSRDAMPRGGEMKIRVSHREISEAQAQHSADARAGKFVVLSHSDTGGGIPPENLPRIFEPFFTTKELGKGSGLGLATVYGVVKQHEGWIEIESELGKGTTFHVFLPATAVPAVEPEQFDTQFRARGGNETILVVEDERDLREMVARTLNRHGYRVFQAVDGPTALEIWNQYKNEISLVFSDVVMPGGMNGRELAEKIRADRPQQKIIFSTGYGTDVFGKDFPLDPELNFLPKPYLPQQLALIIRRCLDAKPA